MQGRQHPTHFGRLLQDLGIAYIAAHSPQAKGRIERLWGTLQDRLVVELRLRGIATVEAANAFLPAFIADFNRRFGQPPAAPALWRRPPRDLARLLGCRYTARVARDNTVRLGARWLQLPRGPHGRSYAGLRVELRELVDGRLLVLADTGRLLAAQPAPDPAFVLTPRKRTRVSTARGHLRTPAPSPPSRSRRPAPDADGAAPRRRPAATHPWRLAADRHLALKALRRTIPHRGDDIFTEQSGRHFH